MDGRENFSQVGVRLRLFIVMSMSLTCRPIYFGQNTRTYIDEQISCPPDRDYIYCLVVVRRYRSTSRSAAPSLPGRSMKLTRGDAPSFGPAPTLSLEAGARSPGLLSARLGTLAALASPTLRSKALRSAFAGSGYDALSLMRHGHSCRPSRNASSATCSRLRSMSKLVMERRRASGPTPGCRTAPSAPSPRTYSKQSGPVNAGAPSRRR